MGAKESRIGFLSYDEALRRVTDIELKRLKDAFKRTCGLSYYMTQQCFIREVLGDGVPPKVAEYHNVCSLSEDNVPVLDHGLSLLCARLSYRF